MNISAIFKATAIAGLLAATPSIAQSADSEEIEYRDLNLLTEKGVERLDYRIRSAVQRVCGNPASPRPLDGRTAMRRCHDEAMEGVQPTRDLVILNARERRPTVEVVRLTVDRKKAIN